MRTVNGTGFVKEHERAVSGHYVYAVLLAQQRGLLIDGALAGRAIHPNPPDAGFHAVLDNGEGFGRGSHQKSAIHWWRDILQPLVTRAPFDLDGFRMDWHYIETTAPEFPEQLPAEVTAIPGYANYRNPLLLEEIIDSFSGAHCYPLFKTNRFVNP